MSERAEPEYLCWTDLVELCRKQQSRIDTLEAASRAAIEEADH